MRHRFSISCMATIMQSRTPDVWRHHSFVILEGLCAHARGDCTVRVSLVNEMPLPQPRSTLGECASRYLAAHSFGQRCTSSLLFLELAPRLGVQ